MALDGLDDAAIRKILTETRVIAMVGASDRPTRPSNGVMRFLQSRGYRVIPVNPNLEGQTLNGERVYPSLQSIPQAQVGRVDMVEIFRNPAAALQPALNAIEIGARVVWMQLGVINHEAAEKARKAGLTVVMDRCPAIEHPRLFG